MSQLSVRKHSEPWQWHEEDIEVGKLRLKEEAMGYWFGQNPEGVQVRET